MNNVGLAAGFDLAVDIGIGRPDFEVHPGIGILFLEVYPKCLRVITGQSRTTSWPLSSATAGPLSRNAPGSAARTRESTKTDKRNVAFMFGHSSTPSAEILGRRRVRIRLCAAPCGRPRLIAPVQNVSLKAVPAQDRDHRSHQPRSGTAHSSRAACRRFVGK